jgi:hypothetical protein
MKEINENYKITTQKEMAKTVRLAANARGLSKVSRENDGFHLHPRRAVLPQNRLAQGGNRLLRMGQVISTALYHEKKIS